MRTLAILLILLALAVVAGVLAFSYWAGFQGNPVDLVIALPADAPPITKLLSLLQAPMAILGVLFGLVMLVDQSRTQHSIGLTILSVLPPLIGILLFINQGVYIHMFVVKTHTTNPKVFGVSVAEALLPLGIGLLAATPAAIVNAILVGRAHRRRRQAHANKGAADDRALG